VNFSVGDRVHFAGLGTGTVIEVRGRARYAVEIKGRVVIGTADDLELADPPKPSRAKRPARQPDVELASSTAVPSLDLHGKTGAEAAALVEDFINEALLAGHAQVRIIHGRSGGQVKAAVHASLRRIATVASFRLEPRNPGATIVTFA
jgi:DNA mismatch repair protein MutS2